ncbi:MAG: ribosomal RNA small subunit methyltransferase A [Desulfobacteraceae bacterium]|nr:ribosomal RNA small subunit methyltransferase A [Desulfobacteraceae bacterium]
MTSPRTILKAWNVHARKEFGQNFLNNFTIAENILARAELKREHAVLEIGAGLGALTIPAAAKVDHLIAVERDPRIIPLLKTELLEHKIDNVRLIEDNVLSLDFQAISKEVGRPLIVIGNLPYSISSQILIKLITERPGIQRAILMFQKELAERVLAAPGSRTYGRLSVILQYCADAGVLFDVKASHFFPKPKVDSTVLEVCFKSELPHAADDEALLVRVVRLAFGKRRKTLKNALAGSDLGLDANTVRDLLTTAGIDPVRRAETLSVAEFVRLSNSIGTTLRRIENA